MSHVKHGPHGMDGATANQIAWARAQTSPSGPISAEAVVERRPSRPSTQDSSTWSVSSRTGRSCRAVIVPSRWGAGFVETAPRQAEARRPGTLVPCG
jgi:hypothetical protein